MAFGTVGRGLLPQLVVFLATAGVLGSGDYLTDDHYRK